MPRTLVYSILKNCCSCREPFIHAQELLCPDFSPTFLVSGIWQAILTVIQVHSRHLINVVKLSVNQDAKWHTETIHFTKRLRRGTSTP